jgi:hypothetical protein
VEVVPLLAEGIAASGPFPFLAKEGRSALPCAVASLLRKARDCQLDRRVCGAPIWQKAIVERQSLAKRAVRNEQFLLLEARLDVFCQQLLTKSLKWRNEKAFSAPGTITKFEQGNVNQRRYRVAMLELRAMTPFWPQKSPGARILMARFLSNSRFAAFPLICYLPFALVDMRHVFDVSVLTLDAQRCEEPSTKTHCVTGARSFCCKNTLH